MGPTRTRVGDESVREGDRNEVGALLFLSPAAKSLSLHQLRTKLEEILQTVATDSASSMHPVRLMVMTEPPSIDANEITDKGYMNQRAVLERRMALVERLYASADRVLVS